MGMTASKTLIAVFAFAVFTGLAQAEARWDGLLNDGNNVNWFALQEEQPKPNSLESRGVQTNFNDAPVFEPEFQIETLRDQVRRPFTSLNRER